MICHCAAWPNTVGLKNNWQINNLLKDMHCSKQRMARLNTKLCLAIRNHLPETSQEKNLNCENYWKISLLKNRVQCSSILNTEKSCVFSYVLNVLFKSIVIELGN